MSDHKCIFCKEEGCDSCNDTGYDTEYTKEMVCPYCGDEFSDSWQWNDSNADAEVDCYECGKSFTLNVDFDVTYTTRRKED